MSDQSDSKYREENIKNEKMQDVNSLYFSMLNQRQQILNKIRFKYGDVKYSGADALEKLYEVFENYTINNANKDDNNEIIWDVVESKIGHSLPLCGRNLTIEDSIENYLTCYKAVVKNGSQGLSAYFSYIYSLIKLVDECKMLSNNEKHTYICLLRNQMSNGELLMLFYFCLSDKKFNNFKLLIERYALFEDLPKEKVLTIIHLDWYSESAYGFYPKD